MTGMKSMESYYQSMNRVYDYIDHNLSEDLSVRTLADISGYSEYHFHRIFHAMAGKNVHEFVFERRLIAAASRLLYEDTSITQVALDCGFSSSGSFTRCFNQCFGCSPSHYRTYKERKRPADTETSCMQYRPSTDLNQLFTVTQLPDLLVAGIVSQSLSRDFQSKNIENAFHRLFAWLHKKNLIHEDLSVMGITMDTPEVLPLDECRYFACVGADDTFRSEGEVSVRTFNAKGKYINFSLERTQKNFGNTFFRVVDYLYGYYLPFIGLIPDNRPFVEFYKKSDAAIEITFCVPVK